MRRFSGGKKPERELTTRPPMAISPSSGCSNPAISRNSVVLPQPLGPKQRQYLAGLNGEVQPGHRLDLAETLHYSGAFQRAGAGTFREAGYCEIPIYGWRAYHSVNALLFRFSRNANDWQCQQLRAISASTSVG